MHLAGARKRLFLEGRGVLLRQRRVSLQKFQRPPEMTRYA
jgi:hypothetical protein